MRRIALSTLLALLAALAYTTAAYAKGGCPSTIKPPGVRVSIPTWFQMKVEGWDRYEKTIQTPHGAVNLTTEPGSHIYAFDETGREDRFAMGSEALFTGLHEDYWGAYYTEHLYMSGPGMRFEPYWYNSEGTEWGSCGTMNGTPYHRGIWSAEGARVWETP